VGRFKFGIRNITSAVRSLVMLPFFLFALVPQGFMPSAGGGGGFTVVLCTKYGVKTVTLDANGVEIQSDSGKDDSGSSATGHCLFAGVGTFVAPARVSLAGPSIVALPRSNPLRPLAWRPASVGGQLGARAPPVPV